MATTVSPSAEDKTHSPEELPHGISPLRAGQGHEFLLRRLHSLSGIVPVGAFLVEHILISNSTAMKGPVAYSNTVEFLGGLPFAFYLELFGIWIPILFHGVYGVYLWMRGTGNLVNYRWMGNWMYSLQRWSGMIAFVYIIYHVYTKRFSGVDLHDHPGASFGKMQESLLNEWIFAFYIIGLLAASWHFGYGVWLFCVKWGIITGEKARKRLLIPCMGLALLIAAVGARSLYAFREWEQQPVNAAAAAKKIQDATEEIPKRGKQ